MDALCAHSGQELTRNGQCFLELVLGFSGNAIDIHPRDSKPSEIEHR
jgi:hypothetical protein